MGQSLPLDISSASLSSAKTHSRAAAVPWHAWSSAIAVTFITFGLYWDISWHMTIGRDTFWTPAHLAVQIGGILAAITCTYLIFSTTFGSDPIAKDSAVGMWGFRGPLGAFLTAWGGVTMVTSAPFDNWWHAAFGLDVEILSSPHVVLGLGINGVVLGSTLLVVSRMNRAEGAARSKLVRMLLYLAGLQLVLHMMLVYEYSDASLMHSAAFYRAMSFGVPLILIAFARASGHKWGSTIVASIYMAFMAITTWTFPLFHATPKLGPVLTNVTHMLPLGFPILLVVPAFFLDLMFQKTENVNRWLQAVLAGTIYLAALVAACWTFSEFMISPQSQNWFFGAFTIPYFFPPSLYHFFTEFQGTNVPLATFLAGMAIAWITAMVSSRIGIALGNAMRRLQR
ncbi:MAG TPA: hypothetical protein VGH65_09100 [Verrucomicrobiaceae bacterium]